MSYGFPYLFLTPEYQGEVGFLAYSIVGITSGLFVMAFHINSYIYYSYRYPFLATLNRPLWKFCLNNSLIPLLFYGLYIIKIFITLRAEGEGFLDILFDISGLLIGSVLTISFSFSYFFGTLKTLDLPTKEGKDRKVLKPLNLLINKEKEVSNRALENNSNINHYLKTPFSIKLARKASHYNKKVLMDTIQQHHFSASIYFVILILLILALNNFSLMIPAAASLFLIFSLYLMIIGAFYSRLKTWTVTLGIFGFLVLNHLSGWDQFKSTNYAFGMNYDVEPAAYSYEQFDRITTDSIVEIDKQRALESLENWKAKFNSSEKPKLLILNVSGGGLRSSLWTVKVLQELDKALGSEVYEQIHLITGSSGGMLGAAYYRELRFQNDKKELDYFPQDEHYLYKIGQDALNPVAYTLAVNDLFFRFHRVEYSGRKYPKDRGYAFDLKFNQNTDFVLNHEFDHYKNLEFESQLPTLILAPTIVNDGRRLLMSTQGLSFLTHEPSFLSLNSEKSHDAVEFSRLFREQSADKLSFVTALRLSASFPYITPLVNLPSQPSVELIDAGVRDNEGLEITLRYLKEFKGWIKNNTSGVHIIQIKANRPNEIPIKESKKTKLDQIALPINGVVQSFNNLQIYNKSILTNWSSEVLDFSMEVSRFSLFEKEDKVSLSWHLTEEEKRTILQTFQNKSNQKELAWLKESLNTPKD